MFGYPYGYNPYMPQQPYQNQNFQQQQMQPQQNQIQNNIKGRAVSSIDEARAAMIDLDGSVSIFPDVANKRIYTKQIGLDGAAQFDIYEKVTVQNSDEQKITNEQIGNAIVGMNAIVADISERLNKLSEEVKIYAESVSTNYANAATNIEQPTVQESTRNGRWKK